MTPIAYGIFELRRLQHVTSQPPDRILHRRCRIPWVNRGYLGWVTLIHYHDRRGLPPGAVCAHCQKPI